MRTQGSRPRTQKKPEAKAKDRPSRGQEQECSRPRTKHTGASVLKEKNVFSGDLPPKRSSKIFLLVLQLRSRGFYVQAYADDLALFVTGADMLWIRGMAQNWSSEQEL